MKNIEEIDSVKRITDWTSQGSNHVPDEIQMGQFVRDLIPYLKHCEFEFSRLKDRINYLENQNNYHNGLDL